MPRILQNVSHLFKNITELWTFSLQGSPKFVTTILSPDGSRGGKRGIVVVVVELGIQGVLVQWRN